MRSRVRFPAEPHFLPFYLVSNLTVMYLQYFSKVTIPKVIIYYMRAYEEGPE